MLSNMRKYMKEHLSLCLRSMMLSKCNLNHSKIDKMLKVGFLFNRDNIQATVSEFLKAYAEKSNRIPREYLQLVSGGDFDMEYITFGFGPIARHGSKDLIYYIMNYFAPNRKQLTKENIANDGLITLVDQTIGVYRFAK